MRILYIMLVLALFVPPAFGFDAIEKFFDKEWKKIEETNKGNLEAIRRQRDQLNEVLNEDYNRRHPKRRVMKPRKKYRRPARNTCEEPRRTGLIYDSYWEQTIRVQPLFKPNEDSDLYTNIIRGKFYIRLAHVDHDYHQDIIKGNKHDRSTWYYLGHRKFREAIDYYDYELRNVMGTLIDPITGKTYCGDKIAVWPYWKMHVFRDISEAKTRKVKRYPKVYQEVNHDTIYWYKSPDHLNMTQIYSAGNITNYLFGPFDTEGDAWKYFDAKIAGPASKYLQAPRRYTRIIKLY